MTQRNEIKGISRKEAGGSYLEDKKKINKIREG